MTACGKPTTSFWIVSRNVNFSKPQHGFPPFLTLHICLVPAGAKTRLAGEQQPGSSLPAQPDGRHLSKRKHQKPRSSQAPQNPQRGNREEQGWQEICWQGHHLKDFQLSNFPNVKFGFQDFSLSCLFASSSSSLPLKSPLAIILAHSSSIHPHSSTPFTGFLSSSRTPTGTHRHKTGWSKPLTRWANNLK